MIPADSPPSFDGHREATFATIHAVAPFYSVLIRANPDEPAVTTEFVCDVCTEIPTPTDGGRTYTFSIRGDVKFQDGSLMTAYDVAASWNKIVNPPDGVISPRRGYYSMVDKIEAPDPNTVVFRLKFATAAFLPALADPYAFIYKKEILDRDPHWFEKNIMGSGPFRFKEYQLGNRSPACAIRITTGPDCLTWTASSASSPTSRRSGSPRSAATAPRSSSAAFPRRRATNWSPHLGDKITVQESDWNCGALITPNHARKPFDDVRVRRALTLAIDRWHGAAPMSRITVSRTVGGVVFPGSPLAATKAELEQLAGYWPDIEKSRAEARRLLKEAGAEGLTFELLNRNVDQPYKFNGIWVIDEWSKIGIHATQRVLPTGPYNEALRNGDFAVAVDAECQNIVNPLLDGTKYLPHSVSDANYGNYEDPTEIDLYDRMLRETGFPAPARPDAAVREARARHRGARNLPAMALPHRALPQLRQRLQDQPQPLRQPGSGDDLARQMRRGQRPLSRWSSSTIAPGSSCRRARSSFSPPTA